MKMAEISAALHVMSTLLLTAFTSRELLKKQSTQPQLIRLGIHTQHFPGHGTPTANKNDARGRKM